MLAADQDLKKRENINYFKRKVKQKYVEQSFKSSFNGFFPTIELCLSKPLKSDFYTPHSSRQKVSLSFCLNNAVLT
jgi:hypothetical protein